MSCDPTAARTGPPFSGDAQAWLDRRFTLSRPAVRLFCFPFAGGSAAFYADWADAFDDAVELVPVQLPGRGALLSAPCATSIQQVADGLSPVIMASAVPVALFGHSMGAIIAFEIARRLDAAGRPAQHLFVSGRPAPQLRRPERRVSRLPRDELVAVLRDYGVVDEEILRHQELLDLLLPMIRADFRMIEEYSYRPGPQLSCPVSAWCGDSDPEVPPATMRMWAEHTDDGFELHVLSGGHFFLGLHRDEMLATVLDRLATPPGLLEQR